MEYVGFYELLTINSSGPIARSLEWSIARPLIELSRLASGLVVFGESGEGIFIKAKKIQYVFIILNGIELFSTTFLSLLGPNPQPDGKASRPRWRCAQGVTARNSTCSGFEEYTCCSNQHNTWLAFQQHCNFWQLLICYLSLWTAGNVEKNITRRVLLLFVMWPLRLQDVCAAVQQGGTFCVTHSRHVFFDYVTGVLVSTHARSDTASIDVSKKTR